MVGGWWLVMSQIVLPIRREVFPSSASRYVEEVLCGRSFIVNVEQTNSQTHFSSLSSVVQRVGRNQRTK